MNFKFSIIAIINTDDNSDIAKYKLYANNPENEIILLDISEKINEQLAKEFRDSNNIKYISLPNKSYCEAFNKGLKEANGEFINFSTQDDILSRGAFQELKKHIKERNSRIMCLKPILIENNVNKSYKIYSKKKRIELAINPTKLNLVLESYFIYYKLLENLKFNETLDYEESKLDFLISLLVKYPMYYTITDTPMYYTIPKEDDTSTNFLQYDKNWYTKSLKDFAIPYLKKLQAKYNTIPAFIQEIMLYYIFAKYNCNLDDRNKMILSKEEALEFFEYTKEALQYIDSKIILNAYEKHLFNMPRWCEVLFIKEKNKYLNIKDEIVVNDESIYLKTKQEKIFIDDVVNEYVKIVAINYNKNKLDIDFQISAQDYLNEDEFIPVIKYNGREIEVKKTNCYPLIKAFGLTIAKTIPFHATLELDNTKKKSKIEFYVKINNKEYKLYIMYSHIAARLNNSKYSYWQFNKNYYLCNKQTYILVEKKKILSRPIKEIKYFLARLLRAKSKLLILKYFFLRFVYFVVKPFYRNKQVWVTFDKLYKAGDDGEYIYKYIIDNHPEIKCYYVINKNSLDYNRLKKYNKKTVLVYGTFKHKLMSLLSTVILDTHANVASYSSFDTTRAQHCICDLFNAEIVCIQHGLVTQKNAKYQNRLFDNINLYCCASRCESGNILDNNIYDYKPEQVKLTGLTRYDGLKNNDKRQILITPTWRRNIVNSSVAYVKKDHNNYFIKSDYYRIYNNLINNKKLLESAKKNKYQIIFLLHPAISAQKDDFKASKGVEIISATSDMNYEKILTESSLMVTDYSGVQFDFAYMRKPIIYYHPEELPPHYDEGNFKYDSMGFGPICKKGDEIVDLICEYMDNNCKMKKEYIKRADDFFEYSDFNNCQRTYESKKEDVK